MEGVFTELWSTLHVVEDSVTNNSSTAVHLWFHIPIHSRTSVIHLDIDDGDISRICIDEVPKSDRQRNITVLPTSKQLWQSTSKTRADLKSLCAMARVAIKESSYCDVVRCFVQEVCGEKENMKISENRQACNIQLLSHVAPALHELKHGLVQLCWLN